MESVSVRDLRNHGGRVLARVARGETLTVTMDGEAVAELRPIVGRGPSAKALLERWRHLPEVDAAAWKADIDTVLDATL